MLSTLILAAALAVPQVREADPARVREIAAFLRDEPGDPAMRVGNRAVWDRFASRKEAPDTIRAAERLLKEPVPVMTDEMFLRYYEKDRSLDPDAVPYYVPFWKRRDGLSALVVAECLENSGRFLPKAEEYIRAICAMRTWVQPSHDPGHRGFDGLVKIIDLGAAEMSVTLALAGDWLRDALSLETRRLVAATLEEQIYSRYRLFNRGVMRPWWFFGEMNWTAVCNGCSTVAALAMLPDRNVRAEFVEAAARTLPGYVNGGFYPDGACKEGMDYWNYGFGNFLRAALYIRRLTDGKVDLTAGEQCERDFAFAFAGMLAPWKAPHFADGAANPNPQVLQLGQAVWPQYRTDVSDSCGVLGGGIARMAAFAFEPGLADRTGDAGPLRLPIRSYLPDAQMLYCRPEGSPADGLYVVMKGGTNGEGHNHNDLGTYAVMFGGVEMAGDPGGAQYTKKTFSSHRYENPILSSFGHPVPVVAGKLQSEGARFAAKTVETRFSDEKDVYRLDLTGSYEAPELASLVRTMGYARQKGVVGFRDEVKFKTPSAFEVPTVTFCKVTPTETKGVYVLEDEKTSVRLSCRFSATGGEWTMKSERIPNPKRREPTRLALTFTAPVSEARVSVVFSQL